MASLQTSAKRVFGPFSFEMDQLLLLRADERIPLPQKDLEMLRVLLEAPGRVVTKQELMDRVWPGIFVEEGNLAKHISNLRQALGEGENGQIYIETIPRRGYRFVAPVRPGKVLDATVPAASSVGARVRTPVTRWVLTYGAGALVVLVVAVWFLTGRAALTFSSRDWVVVADFENHTGDPRLDKALLTAFTVTLQQSRHANVVPAARIGSALRRMGRSSNSPVTQEIGREICLREGARALLVPAITRAGTHYAISAQLVDPTNGEVVHALTEKADNEDALLDALDRLAESTRQALGESLYSIGRSSRPLLQVTTPSLRALVLYSDGSEAWSKGGYTESVKLMEAAIELDPNFAMAHRALGRAYLSHVFNEPAKGKEHFETAIRLANRTTDREHPWIAADYQAAQGNYERAIPLMRTFLESFPDDSGARFTLATTLLQARRSAEAIVEFVNVLRLEPSNTRALLNLATTYAVRGEYAEALLHYDRAFAIEPERLTSVNLNHEYGFCLVGAGQSAKAREVFSLAVAKPELRARGLRSLGLLDFFEGRARQAETHLREAYRVNMADKNALGAARDGFYLAQLYEARGDSARSVQQLEENLRILETSNTQAPWLEAWIGIYLSRLGAVEQAQKLMARLRRQTQDANPDLRRDLDRLEGEIALARGQFGAAIDRLEQADRGSNNPATLESLARAYRAAGEEQKAAARIEKLLAQQGGWIGWEPQQDWLSEQLHLAKIYLRRGESRKAGETLDKLLGIWKDADTDYLPLIAARGLRAQALP